jgi:hypothetical protein
MKKKTIGGIMAAAVLLAGCGKMNDSSVNSSVPAKQQDTRATAGILQPALTVWQQGDQSGAIRLFLEADWSSRPLFTPGSPLNLSEKQFGSLPAADRGTKAQEISTELGVLKHLLAAVTKAGLDAAAKQDVSTVRKDFTSLKQCGEALDRPDSLAIVKLVGHKLKENAEVELAKLGQ